jgi:hypothetical protein
MVLLDALYQQILSNVPRKIMIHTRKLLLVLASDLSSTCQSRADRNFIVLCKWLGMTINEAYAAVNHLHSIFCVPRRDNTHNDGLRVFHQSFIDYISDFSRPGLSHNIHDEAP